MYYKSTSLLNINILSIACSTGEEVYSLSIMMAKLKLRFPDISYNIKGIDVDIASIETAKKGIYKKDLVTKYFEDPSLHFDPVTKDSLKIKRNYMNSVNFECANILNYNEYSKYNIIFCRNVMIYCDHVQTKEIIDKIYSISVPFAHIFLGSSEAIEYTHHGIIKTGKSIYKTRGNLSHFNMDKNNIFVPKVFAYNLSYETFEKLARLIQDKVNVKVHDFKPNINKNHLMTGSIIFTDHESSLLNLTKEIGTYFIEKIIVKNIDKEFFSYYSDSSSSHEILGVSQTFAKSEYISEKIEAQATKIDEEEAKPLDLIVIGCSTGGPEALKVLLKNLPRETPPIVILQHILPNFSAEFSSKLSREINKTLFTGMKEHLKKNHIYMTTKNFDMRMGTDRQGFYVEKVQNKSSYHPNIDFFMNSIVTNSRRIVPNTVAYLLTGMGSDGASGMKNLRNHGAVTYGQSQESCVVYGMPQAAKNMGAIMFELGLEDLNLSLLNVINKRKNAPKIRF